MYLAASLSLSLRFLSLSHSFSLSLSTHAQLDRHQAGHLGFLGKGVRDSG